MSLSVGIITMNEEQNIRECVDHLSFADEILVVDGGSSDRTVSNAKAAGAIVHEIPFTNFSSQRNQLMSHAQSDWILFVDADERLSDDLIEEITNIIESGIDSAYAIPRNTYFFGQRLRFSGTQGDAPIRLFPKNKVEWNQPVHERIATSLPIKTLRNPMDHFSTRDRSHYQQKTGLLYPFGT